MVLHFRTFLLWLHRSHRTFSAVNILATRRNFHLCLRLKQSDREVWLWSWIGSNLPGCVTLADTLYVPRFIHLWIQANSSTHFEGLIEDERSCYRKCVKNSPGHRCSINVGRIVMMVVVGFGQRCCRVSIFVLCF